VRKLAPVERQVLAGRALLEAVASDAGGVMAAVGVAQPVPPQPVAQTRARARARR
jgi:hypothetical protein